VPASALQLLPGEGGVVGAALTASAEVNGVCFTGSTATAQAINRSMAEHAAPSAPLIAETGGLNAMIVDSTALPEQAVRDIVASSFQSAGQRCSALRVLYLQKDIAEPFLKMLYGAMDELVVGDPWEYATDVGPVIDAVAQNSILAHIDAARATGRLLKQVNAPVVGTFVPPTAIEVSGIMDLEEEIFGPVLHIATYASDDLDRVLADINKTGFGLTFGLHSRIDDRVEYITSRLKVGNMYINRNQIGAVVGSQPFGGEGMSGTGPKAGGPSYVKRFTQPASVAQTEVSGAIVSAQDVQARLNAVSFEDVPLGSEALPGPTGESNLLSNYAKGRILCLGPSREAVLAQAKIARAQGCGAVLLRAYRRALANRSGKLIPLITQDDLAESCRIERHICIDTTAAGGNASLLAEVS